MINKMKALLLIGEKGFIPCLFDDWNNTAQELHQMQEAHKELSIGIKMLTDRLVKLSEEKNVCGKEFYFHKIERKGSVDYSVIPELKSIDLEKYRKEDVSYWKLESY